MVRSVNPVLRPHFPTETAEPEEAEGRPSSFRMAWTWLFTVRWLMNNLLAIAASLAFVQNLVDLEGVSTCSRQRSVIRSVTQHHGKRMP
jgi:hypothetical protein